ncbi:MAG: glyoxalase/bleomycin resistance/extradiol dioxygenase family protein [Myxococcales bacterium]|nr:glyoxalase/bleomycin resistance/extradiol dioxygenase family protein [Myxococcales bacterium]
MRLQLALNVNDLKRSVDYYTALFGTPPHKQRPGYANFAIASPPLKLVLFENPGADERLNHLGVEVATEDELGEAEARLHAAGLVDDVQRDSVCCHAKQDKVWSLEPDGLRFEWYRITDDQPIEEQETASCCGDETTSAAQTKRGACCAGGALEEML